MITRQMYIYRLMHLLYQKAGLVNGSIGTVREVVWSVADRHGSLPELVVVEFDDYRGPCFPKWKDDETKQK